MASVWVASGLLLTVAPSWAKALDGNKTTGKTIKIATRTGRHCLELRRIKLARVDIWLEMARSLLLLMKNKQKRCQRTAKRQSSV